MDQLLNGKQLLAYLGIEADTLRRIRTDDPNFPGFFTRKLYSKPEIDAWLRRRIPPENNQSEEINLFDIEADVEKTIDEIFSSSPREEASPRRMPLSRAASA
jgi:hypothetical protein